MLKKALRPITSKWHSAVIELFLADKHPPAPGRRIDLHHAVAQIQPLTGQQIKIAASHTIRNIQSNSAFGLSVVEQHDRMFVA